MTNYLLIILFTLTRYIDKTYTTECAVDVCAPAEVSDSIITRFIKDFQKSPDALFDWAFYGVGAQDTEEKNAFLLEYKETVYIPEQNYGKIVTDIVIPNFTRFKNITIEGVVIDEKSTQIYHPNLQAKEVRLSNMPIWSRHIDIQMEYSGRLLKQGFGDLYIIPVDETHSIYYMDINLQYGWFFNIFVTMKVYKNSVEWRVSRYMQNLKYVAEQLYKEQNVHSKH